MKNIVMGIVITQIVSCASLIQAMEYAYAQATNEHVSSVVQLINDYAYRDSDKIVIVPKAFRQDYVQSAVDAGRLFVATHGEQVIGYKKLFCITDPTELKKTLNDEIRCNSTPEVCGAVVAPAYDTAKPIDAADMVQLNNVKATYIYTGTDFTHPDHRKKSVNTALMDYALAVISSSVIKHCRQHESTHLAMVYGLTKSNAGDNHNNVLGGRTHGILAEYVSYAQSIAHALKAQSPTKFYLSRHHAFKPSFDPDATECKPLPDEQSKPGYGCVIACALERSIFELMEA